MVGVGCLGILMSVTAIVVGQGLVGQVESSVDDSLTLTSDALQAVSDSIVLTGTIVTTIQDGVAGVASTLDSVTVSLDEATVALTSSNDFIGGSLPDALEAVGSVLVTIESVASSVDSALRTVSSAPFGPDYDPDQPFDEAIADLSSAIDPLPEELRQLSQDIEGLETSGTTIADDLTDLALNVVALDEQLGEVSTLLDRYATTTAEAQALSAESRDDLRSSARQAKLLLVVLGVVFALGQVVPIWLGMTLIKDSSAVHTVITRTHD